jgi:hypothetical protein
MNEVTRVFIVWERKYQPIIDTVWLSREDAEKRRSGILKRLEMNGCIYDEDYARVEAKDVF